MSKKGMRIYADHQVCPDGSAAEHDHQDEILMQTPCFKGLPAGD
jgi:hypothetical protein